MTLAPQTNTILSVSSLNRLVRDCLEAAFPLMWVGGEISNLTYASSGHVYFSLKDKDAQVRCVMWRSKAQLLGWRLENGQKIEARALVSFYEPRGEFQLNVDSIRRAGQGNLFEQFVQLKAKLEAEGLFAPANKRPLPAHPQALAIVTSLQAAALRDVLTTLSRRAPQIRIELYPTLVQGEGAAAAITQALEAASASHCDAIILCRGGGSLEDLWAFNDETLARAIRAAQLPVVAGIGHETDFTIADFAADYRAATPTAAAEILSPDRQAQQRHLQQLHFRLKKQVDRDMAQRSQAIDWLAVRLIHPAEKLRQQQVHLGQLQQALQRNTHNRLQQLTYRLAQHSNRLQQQRPRFSTLTQHLVHLQYRLWQQPQRQLERWQMKLNQLQRSLTQLDPLAVLERGYTLALTEDGKAVRDAGDLAAGQSLRLRFARGEAETCVRQVVVNAQAD